MSGDSAPGHRARAHHAGDYCVLVVAKAPVPGEVKTRLCPPATAPQAAELAAASLLDTLDTVLTTPAAVPVVALAGDLGRAVCGTELAAALRRCAVVFGQRGNGFAHRLVNAHLDTAARLPALPVLQIGMDTPQVTPELLSRVADMLSGADAVLGPARDGGWWALGLRQPEHARLLTDVPMSRSDTGELTRRALASASLAPLTAPTMSDVDTIADAESVLTTAPDGRFATTLRRLLPAMTSTKPNRHLHHGDGSATRTGTQ